MCMLGNGLAIVVCGNLTMILFPYLRTCQALGVIAHGEHELVGDHALRHQIEGHSLGHLHNDDTGFLERVGFL